MTEVIKPMVLADELLEMAKEYENIGNKLVAIKVKKATEIIYIRAKEDMKSDAMAERVWTSTPDGLKELEYVFRLKSLEKLMSAIKAKLRILEHESFNQY